MQRDVDLIAYGPTQSAVKPVGDPPRSGSPRSRCGRSSVVSTEGADSSPPDWGNVSEACEIGGLGTLVLARVTQSKPQGLARPERGLGDDFDRSVTKLWPGTGREPQYPLPRAAFEPCV